MKKAKTINGSIIATIVLSVLLIMSITAGSTFAWFASRDDANKLIKMGEAVVVTLGEDYKQGSGDLTMDLPVNEATNGLLPGMVITPNIKIQLQQSNTKALLRARFLTNVEYPNNYVDAKYRDEVKYPNKEPLQAIKDGGKVIQFDGAEGPILENVYQGLIYYDYFNEFGEKIKYKNNAAGKAPEELPHNERVEDGVYTEEPEKNHSITINLKRVEVRSAIMKAFKALPNENQYWDYATGAATTTVNEAAKLDDKNLAAIEIRQRGYDLAKALNAVINGEEGYTKEIRSGKIVRNGVKNTRKVADGWAYRQADQCWYFLGSSTNGFELKNDSGVDETVTATSIVKDITSFAPGSGSQKVPTPVYELTKAGANVRNYLGTPSTENGKKGEITKEDNEKAVLNQKSIASIDTSAKNGSINFLTKKFSLPIFIDNDYAQARVQFTMIVEAIQDYLVDPQQEAVSNTEQIPNNLVNAILVFNSGFPNEMNVVPGGGSAIEYNPLDGATAVTGKEITTVSTSDAKSFDKEQVKESDNTTYYRSNYKTPLGTYNRGTASSLGICPFISSTWNTQLDPTPAPPPTR